MKHKLFFIFFLSFGIAVNAQVNFIKKGKIEFERKTNVHRLYFTDESSPWMDDFKKLVPQFRTDYFDLLFSENKTIYQPGRESGEPRNGFFQTPATDIVVYKDLAQQSVISQKQIFESQFLLTDSIRQLKWKIEPETRTIAGFECRKALTRICDSVVVVAFYTDEILAPGGPESFSGLPGMILGIAIPRLYTTWFATKVEILNEQEQKKILPPTKGKKTNMSEMVQKIKDGIKDWGPQYFHRAIWFAIL